MGKVEAIIKSEIIRLAKRELRKISVPLGRDVRFLKGNVSQIGKAVLVLQRFAAQQEKELGREKARLQATPEEVGKSRFSPRLVKSLRKQLGITQKELGMLAGVTVGAVQKWESGRFRPKDEKRRMIVALRKLGRREARGLLSSKTAQSSPKRPKRRGSRRKYRK
jgi:DNA-binding transcriptional regulator YiaG